MKAKLTIKIFDSIGKLETELKLWSSWDTLSIIPSANTITVNGKTFNKTYPLDGTVEIEVENILQDE